VVVHHPHHRHTGTQQRLNYLEVGGLVNVDQVGLEELQHREHARSVDVSSQRKAVGKCCLPRGGSLARRRSVQDSNRVAACLQLARGGEDVRFRAGKRAEPFVNEQHLHPSWRFLPHTLASKLR